MQVKGNLAEELMNFGLTRQEATIYLLLLEQGECTGYEVSKITGISRSNTYNALAGLVEKGAAYIVEGTSTKYISLDIKEFTGNVIKKLRRKQDFLVRNQPSHRQKSEGYITIMGKEHVLDKIGNMIAGAQKRVYFAAPSEIINMYRPELKTLKERNIKLVLFCECQLDIAGSTVYVMENMQDQIRLIVDSENVFTGNISEHEEPVCLYSRNKNLVDVFKEMMRSEIVLLEQKYHTEQTVIVAMPREI